jgi:hypothetical protein
MNHFAESEDFVMPSEDMKTLINRSRLLRNEMIYQSCLRFLRRLKSSPISNR